MEGYLLLYLYIAYFLLQKYAIHTQRKTFVKRDGGAYLPSPPPPFFLFYYSKKPRSNNT